MLVCLTAEYCWNMLECWFVLLDCWNMLEYVGMRKVDITDCPLLTWRIPMIGMVIVLPAICLSSRSETQVLPSRAIALWIEGGRVSSSGS